MCALCLAHVSRTSHAIGRKAARQDLHETPAPSHALHVSRQACPPNEHGDDRVKSGCGSAAYPERGGAATLAQRLGSAKKATCAGRGGCTAQY